MRRFQRLTAGVIVLGAALWPATLSGQRATGTGQQASALFNLPGGLVIFELAHDGDGDFVVRLLDDRGVLIDTIARAIGPFRGSKAIHVPRAGSYLYDVRAGGAWTVNLRPSPSATGDSAAAGGPLRVAGSAATVPSTATASSIVTQASVDAEQAARRRGAFPWLLRGLGGGMVLGPVGAGLVFVAANKRERAPVSAVETRRATHGDAYANAFSAAYEAKRRSDRRVASLVGGATGSVIFAFVITQIVNWSRESGGRDGPPGGELP